ncbi:MAG: divalent-cation tolerance protein CutA [Pontiellaceae bacterium]|nr:divalent-cation tolerance protein CutA [Pontiellaceae bacterium]MBN2783494.1 divalent-cation tolerance protein CutA [Pontiellaceae bacterium]
MNTMLVYVTVKDAEEARRIAKTVVDERLAACANLLGGVESIYRWQDKICEDRETAMILKTTADLQDALSMRIQELHSYDCPCVVCLPINGGNPDFLQWIEENTGIA